MAVPLCQVTGLVQDPAGNPIANSVVTFNSVKTQVIGADVIFPLVVSTTTDANGMLSAIGLAQGLFVQVTVSNFSPVLGIVPLSSSVSFAALISGTLTVPSSGAAFSIITLTGTATPAPSAAGQALFLYSTTTNSVLLSQNGGAFFPILTPGNISSQFPWTVPQGGTGRTTLTNNGVLYGAGTGAINSTAAGAANTVLVSAGGAPSFSNFPIVQSLAATANIATPVVASAFSGTVPLLLAAAGPQQVRFATDGVTRWLIGSTGGLFPQVNNTYPLGDTAFRVSKGWFTELETSNAPIVSNGIIRQRFFPMGGALILSGTPVETGNNFGSYWIFDDTAAAIISVASIPLPEDYKAGTDIDLFVSIAGATAVNTDVVVTSQIGRLSTSLTGTNVTSTAAVTLPGTPGILAYQNFASFVPVANQRVITLNIGRDPTNPSDNASGDIYFFSVAVEYTAVR